MPADMARLITDNLDKLRAYSRKIGKHNHEDVFQEACATILESRSYDPSKSRASWLYLHVRSAAARVLKGQTKLPPAGTPGGSEWLVPPVEANQPYVFEMARLLERAEHLPDRQRDVFKLVANDNTLSEAGQVMGITKQAAGVHLQKARWALGIAA